MRRNRLLGAALAVLAVLALVWAPGAILDSVSAVWSGAGAAGTADVAKRLPVSIQIATPTEEPTRPATPPPPAPPTEPPAPRATEPATVAPTPPPAGTTAAPTAAVATEPPQTHQVVTFGRSKGPPTPDPTVPPILTVVGADWVKSPMALAEIEGWRKKIEEGVAAAKPPAPILACPSTAHVAWSFAMPPGPRVAAAVRSLLPPANDTTSGPFDVVNFYVADRALLDVDPDTWAALLAHPALEVNTLRTESLLDGTPMQRWGHWTTPWKIFAGPDFPYQLDLAVRLALAFKHGGHVFPFDFLRLPHWPANGDLPYLVQGTHYDIGWLGGVGPLCAPAGHVLVMDLMHALAASLDDCVGLAYGSSAESGFTCAIQLNDLRRRMQEHALCTVPAAELLLTNLRVPTGDCRVLFSAHDAVAGVGTGPSAARVLHLYNTNMRSFLGLDSYFGAGPFIGVYLAHILLGHADMPEDSLIVQLLKHYGQPASVARGTGAWHQGCQRPNSTEPVTALAPLADRLASALHTPSPDRAFATFAFLVALKSFNLGDDVQAFAAIDFLPFLGYAINRDRWQYVWALASAVGRAPTRTYPDFPAKTIFTIVNGWWDYLVRDPPTSAASAINSVFTGFHMARYRIKSKSGPSMAEILRKFSPIGVRDLHTLEFLKNYTVPAYLAGCMTTTLRNPWPNQRTDKIYLVPKYEEDIAAFQRILPPEVLVRAQWLSIHMARAEVKMVFRRSMRAWDLMHHYATAGLVITSALHSALPSIAFDTPTLFLHDRNKFLRDERFPGLSDIFPTVRLFTNISSPITDFDFDRPLPPSSFAASYEYLSNMRSALRLRLRNSCPAVDIAMTLSHGDDGQLHPSS